MFIVVLAMILTILVMTGVLAGSGKFLYLPLLSCYYIGRYVSSYHIKSKSHLS